MTHDPASFDKTALLSIYGEDVRCFLCPMYKAVDWHHNFQRQNGKKETRAWFSSVFNAVPLSRDLHDTCPFLTTPEFQQTLFRHTMKRVNYAVARGDYELTENDHLFLKWVSSRSAD